MTSEVVSKYVVVVVVGLSAPWDGVGEIGMLRLLRRTDRFLESLANTAILT